MRTDGVADDKETSMIGTGDMVITVDDVMADLGAGRWRPLTVPAPWAPPRPVLGGHQFRRTLMTARAQLAMRLPADAALERLWFTPWATGRVRPRPEGAAQFRVPWDDGALQGWRLGSGPTVLLVHGWGGTSTDLAALARHLADAGHHVVAVDLPAHGASPGDTTDLFALARAVRSAAEAAGGVQAIVAHSLGSVAALLALAEGLDVARVALVSPPATLDGAVARFIDRTGLAGRGDGTLRRRIEQTYGDDVWDRLRIQATAPQVTADVLVVHDVDDTEVPVADGVRVARALSGQPVVTTGLGHGRILADPLVIRHVAAHLDGERVDDSMWLVDPPVLAS
jgi:pimeloyl-ACP methyl ester carboxylesterase